MKILHDYLLVNEGEGGYAVRRIPGLITCDDGSIICYYECRSCLSDWALIDIGMRKSTDGGLTWSEECLIAFSGGKNTVNNPVMMVAESGKLIFMYLENYKRLFQRESTDHGESWSEAHEITDALDAFRPEYAWTCAAVGPGHGCRLPSGRLVINVWLACNPEKIFEHWPSVVSCLYSDDEGASWQRGHIIYDPVEGANLNEAVIVPLASGGVLFNIRNYAPCKRRYLAYNEDAAGEWLHGHFAENLPDPCCMAGMCRAGDDLLYCSCDTDGEGKMWGPSRIHLTLQRSHDDGRTWEKCYLSKIGGYSDVCVTEDKKTALVFYEHNDCKELRIARVAL